MACASFQLSRSAEPCLTLRLALRMKISVFYYLVLQYLGLVLVPVLTCILLPSTSVLRSGITWIPLNRYTVINYDIVTFPGNISLSLNDMMLGKKVYKYMIFHIAYGLGQFLFGMRIINRLLIEMHGILCKYDCAK